MSIGLDIRRYSNILYGRWFDVGQAWRIRGRGTIYTLDGYELMSENSPEILGNTIYLPGRIEWADYRVMYYQYVNPGEAEKALRMFKKLVKETNYLDNY